MPDCFYQYRQKLYLAQFNPMPPDRMALRALLRNRPEDTQRFYLVNQGMVARETFFNPQNLQRLWAS